MSGERKRNKRWGRQTLKTCALASLLAGAVCAGGCGGDASGRPQEDLRQEREETASGGDSVDAETDGAGAGTDGAGGAGAGTDGAGTGTDGAGTGGEEDEAMEEPIQLTESYKGLDHANPLISQSFGADPYALVYEDRVYLYMTGDTFEYDGDGKVAENTYSKINRIRVISTDDMANFTDHGAITVASAPGAAASWARNSWAPAAAWKEINGKPQFFLYFADGGGGIGVLCADSPTGPFRDPLGKGLVTRQTPNCADVLWLFDPAVLADDDGRYYLYFGGGVPEGKQADPGTARVVELGEDMISIVGEPKKVDAPYLFEDSGIHKAGDKYYYTYCTNWQVDQAGTAEYGFHNAEIACMASDSPMGPFMYQETILKNPGGTFGLYGNNHHCVFNFQGNWYITYHTRVLEKAMGVEKGYRSTHIDQFTMQEDGAIGTIKQTLKGRTQLKYVDPYEENRAACAAVMGGIECVPSDGSSRYYGCGNMALGGIDTGDFVKVQGVDFGEKGASKVTLTAANLSGEEGTVQIRLDGPEGEVIGNVPIGASQGDEYTAYTADVLQTGGVHDVFFIFRGAGYEIETWRFEE